jgi:hypothetical protein
VEGLNQVCVIEFTKAMEPDPRNEVVTLGNGPACR